MTKTKPPRMTSKRSSLEPDTSRTMRLVAAAGRRYRNTAPNTRSRKFHTVSTILVKRLALYQTSTLGLRRRKRTTALCGNARLKGR